MTYQHQSTSSDSARVDQQVVTERCIRERAYQIYVQRGCKGGHADGDWLTAEAELKELKKKAADMVAAIGSLTEKP
jgi:hypothetical protein